MSTWPDKVINAVQIYLIKHLGRQFVEPQITDMSTIYTESSNVTPIVFILSSGTDPAADLYKFADRLKNERQIVRDISWPGSSSDSVSDAESIGGDRQLGLFIQVRNYVIFIYILMCVYVLHYK